ncbi:unnamed protein product, partial [Linum tenue]
LNPIRIADFSPAVSPSGFLTAVASYGQNGWNGKMEELSTDIYVFLTRWPSWVDDSVIVTRITPPGIHAFTPATSPGNTDFMYLMYYLM